ncbi:hypothetical protein NE237_018688 [Protea cynaroides]|uniref:Uncharacterized protein n=1 Tax=Protea cynaroides TaxID=273540 RepID=A0A9Q0QPE5_9MAGN|nr:hypothetical protein NE237_018688 [Protea cynaroides]
MKCSSHYFVRFSKSNIALYLVPLHQHHWEKALLTNFFQASPIMLVEGFSVSTICMTNYRQCLKGICYRSCGITTSNLKLLNLSLYGLVLLQTLQQLKVILPLLLHCGSNAVCFELTTCNYIGGKEEKGRQFTE